MKVEPLPKVPPQSNVLHLEVGDARLVVAWESEEGEPAEYIDGYLAYPAVPPTAWISAVKLGAHWFDFPSIFHEEFCDAAQEALLALPQFQGYAEMAT